jgi:hypothetical protein
MLVASRYEAKARVRKRFASRQSRVTTFGIKSLYFCLLNASTNVTLRCWWRHGTKQKQGSEKVCVAAATSGDWRRRSNHQRAVRNTSSSLCPSLPLFLSPSLSRSLLRSLIRSLSLHLSIYTSGTTSIRRKTKDRKTKDRQTKDRI